MSNTDDSIDTDQTDCWSQMRGALREVFAALGCGDNYLRDERHDFCGLAKNPIDGEKK